MKDFVVVTLEEWHYQERYLEQNITGQPCCRIVLNL